MKINLVGLSGLLLSLLESFAAVSVTSAHRFAKGSYTFGLEPIHGAVVHRGNNEPGVRISLTNRGLIATPAITVWRVIFN